MSGPSLPNPPPLLRALTVWIAVALIAGVFAGVHTAEQRGDDAPDLATGDLPPIGITIPSLPSIPPVTVPGLPPITVPGVTGEIEVDLDLELPPLVEGPIRDLVGTPGTPVTPDRPGLWLIDADSGSATVLFADEVLSGVSFAPDGRRAAVVTYDGPDRHGSHPKTMWVVDLATGLRRAVAGPDMFISGPSWSPDGAWIAHSADRGNGDDDPTAPPGPHGVGSVWIVRPDGRDAHRVSVTDGYGGHYSWSPDGRSFTASLFNDDRVLVADVRAGTERRLPIEDPAYAEWSPAGGALAVSTTFDGPLSVMDPVTGATRTIAADLWGPIWSPDGRWIAAQGDDPEDGAFLLRPDGSERRHVTWKDVRDWSSDGQQLLLGGYGLGLSVLDVATGQERVFANRPVDGLDWQGDRFVPGTHRAAMLVWP